ncbi:MAG: cation:proton antiporter [Candidatus Kapabacteria bacterium]|nr:cation:proton antiporter [Ignavibacteriota bacterium]MCW5886191.1 cation:proton antiporter [Candidatus Kapabacteria bacterium]
MSYFEIVVYISLGLIGLSMLIVLYRIIYGPAFEDRVVALDLISTSTIAFIAAYAILTNTKIVLDVGIIIGLISFIATIGFAYYLERRTSDG